MDFFPKGLKGFAAEAATALNRAVQFTEERLGHAGERTELDGYLENLLSRAEQIKSWTEKLVGCVEAVLQPNPGTRVEDYLFEKLAPGSESKRASERLRNLEALGSCMLAAGQELAPAGARDNEPNYGNALVKCGKTQLKIGQFEREFANKAERDLVRPLKRFLDEDAKALARERRTLEIKRLDFDAIRAKYKRGARGSQATNATTGQQFTNMQQPAQQRQDEMVARELGQTEAELQAARQEFDKQVELVTRLCNRIIQSSEQHAKCLSKFIEAQAEFYQQSDERLEDLMTNREPESARNNSTGFASLAALSDPEPDGEPAA